MTPAKASPRVTGRREGRADPLPAVRKGQNVRRRLPARHSSRQRGVVDAAVLAADDQRDPAAGKGVEGGERRQHVGGQAVVDEADPVHRADGGEPAGQPLVPGGGGAQRLVVVRAFDAEGAQHAPGDQRVPPVVPARQPERVQPRRAWLVGFQHPLDAGREQAGAGADQLAVAVGDGEFGARLGAGGQLVAVVLLDAAVPGQVVGVQRGHRGDRRGRGEVGRLVAGDLDHPVVAVAGQGGVVRSGADVAAHHRPVPEAGQQVAEDRGGGGLALGAGDADDPVPVGLLQPQPEAAGQHHTRLPQPVGLRAVAADPRGLHHDLAAQQRVKAAVGGGQDVLVSRFSRCGVVVHEDGLDAERAQLAEVRLALAAETPDADASPAQVAPSPASAVPGS